MHGIPTNILVAHAITLDVLVMHAIPTNILVTHAHRGWWAPMPKVPRLAHRAEGTLSNTLGCLSYPHLPMQDGCWD